MEEFIKKEMLEKSLYNIIIEKSRYVHVDVNRVAQELNIEPEEVIEHLMSLDSQDKIICNKVSGSVYSIRILSERK